MLPKYRLMLVILVIGLAFPLRSGTGSAQATPTANEICPPFIAVGAATPASDSGSPVDIDPATLEFDQLFLEAMVPHHEMTILIAQVGRDRTERSELTAFADTLIAGRQAEAKTMREWRGGWYEDSPMLSEDQLIRGMNAKLSENPGMGGVAGIEDIGVEHMAAELSEFCAAGNESDLRFIDLMLAHHSSAIVLGQEAVTRGLHQELRELASAIVATQQYEVDQLLTWREIWYEGAPFPEH